ncbi:MAG: DUF4337 family protein [Tepidisphaeraceae bacterium]|jgi:hypothetical protein
MAKTSQFASLANDPEHKRTRWETILVSTPIILTVVATVLAGLSSSEMSSAQYYRSLAAQMQSKASDQWGYFQAKKIRAEQCGNTVEILRGISQPTPADARDLRETAKRLTDEMLRVGAAMSLLPHPMPLRLEVSAELSEHWKAAAAFVSQIDAGTTRPDGADDLADFMRGEIPDIQEQPIGNQQIIGAVLAVDSRVPEADLERQAGQIFQGDLDGAIAIANENAAAFDKAVEQISPGRARIERACTGISREAGAFERAARRAPDEVIAIEPANSIASMHELSSQLSSAVAIAGLNFNSNRYQREAHYNQVVAQLLEVQVRRQSFISDRHRVRSREFFYGMLGAQAGVTIATFSLAVRRGSWLWGLAASAGLAAVTFAAYVYLFV